MVRPLYKKKPKKVKVNVWGISTSVFLLFGLFVTLFLLRFIQNTRSNATTTEDFNNSFVTVRGTNFEIDGLPFKFVGFNLFDAAATNNYQCAWWPRYSDSDLDNAFQYIHNQAGATVLRFWAYQTYTKGGTDWSGVDKVIALAKKYDMKVIPVLEDGPGYCTTGTAGQAKWQYQGDTWYTNGYKVPYGNATLSYRDYVQKIVAHYKDEPAILGWMMMNEADTSAKDSSGKSVLVGFAQDIGTLIKSIDPNHLVTVGTQSNGASGASGSDFVAVYGLPQIDFAEGHDWGYWGRDTDPLPGSSDGVTLPDPNSPDCTKQYQAKLACSIANAMEVVHKPFIIGEVGIAANDDTSRARRATLLDAKMNAAFANGVSGYLVWQFNKVVDTEQYDVLQTTNDPLIAVMAKYAHEFTIALPSLGIPTVLNTPTPTQPVVPTATMVILPTATPTLRPTATPTLRPTVTPLPTRNPSPTPRHTKRILPTSTPKPLPTPTPVPVQVSSSMTLLGSQMTYSSGTGAVYADSTATNGKALLLSSNTTAQGYITGPIHNLLIRAKEDACLGDPHINILVDGHYVFDNSIRSTVFQTYATDSFGYLGFTNAPHLVQVVYNNDWNIYFCDRNVRIDSIIGQ